MGLPRVRIFNAVSVDGRMDPLAADLELFYEIATKWRQDAVLTGSGTVLAATPDVEPEDPEKRVPEVGEDDKRPWMVVVDSGGRVRSWHMFRHWPYFKGVMALVSRSTPKEYLEYLAGRSIPYIMAGDGRVDLRKALLLLNEEYGVRDVRVDSGGSLNGALLRQGLVDEVHLLVHPQLIGGESASSVFKAADLGPGEAPIGLVLKHVRRPRPGYLWLEYWVDRTPSEG